MMDDGNYTVYAIQFRPTHVSNKWGDPKSKIVPYKKVYESDDGSWGYTGTDYWGKAIDPKIGSGNAWRSRNQKAHDELFDSKMNAGVQGFYTLKYAIQAIKRLRKLNKEGEWDSIDPGFSRKNMQRRIHEFRIVKVVTSQKTEVLELDDVLNLV